MERKNRKTVIAVTWCLSLLVAVSGGVWIGHATNKGENAKLAEIQNLIRDNYYQEVSDEQLEEGLLHGAVLALGDPYSAYMNPEEKQAYSESLEGAYVGIGVLTMLDKDQCAVVAQVYRDTPAQQAGLQKGDVFVAVNGKNVDGPLSDLTEVTSKIRGEKGTEVTVTVARNGQTLDFTMKRAQVHINYVSYRMLNGTIGYIKMDEFSGDALSEYQKAVTDLKSAGMQKLVLDLRDNPGGFVDYAVEIADELLPSGTIISVKDKNGESEEYTSDEKAETFPMAVLVNGNTASASEILTAALKDYGRATIIGEKTYGKGIIQSHFNLSWGGYLKLTTASYYSPKGTPIHEVGVTPDVEVSLPEALVKNPSSLTDENDVQLQKALETLAQ